MVLFIFVLYHKHFPSLREHVFILGLDSSFPGNPKENYLIYDEEYIKMDALDKTSTEIIKDKERLMKLLISLCEELSF